MYDTVYYDSSACPLAALGPSASTFTSWQMGDRRARGELQRYMTVVVLAYGRRKHEEEREREANGTRLLSTLCAIKSTYMVVPQHSYSTLVRSNYTVLCLLRMYSTVQYNTCVILCSTHT